MSKRSRQIETEKFQRKFKKSITEISRFLDKIPVRERTIVIQAEDSEVTISDIDIAFGVIHEENQIIYGKWILDVKVKEREPIIEFLIAKESFKLFFDYEFSPEHQYYDFFEIFLNILTIQWLVELDIVAGLSDAKKMDIFKRTGFQDKDYIKLRDFTYIIHHSYRNDISPKSIYNYILFLLTEGINKEISKNELFEKMLKWFKKQFELQEVALPLTITKRYFDIISELYTLGFKTSAKKIGEKLDLSYNVINIDFKRLYDKYSVSWQQNIKQYKLGIYPYFIRIFVSNNEHLETTKKVLDPYQDNIPFLNVGRFEEGSVITAYIECSHLIHQQLEFQFEKLAKKKVIIDHFFSMIRRKRISSAFVIDEELEHNKETYNQLLNNPDNFPIQKLIFLDEKYDFTPPARKRKLTIDENVLYYLSILKGRHLGKAHYLFSPIPVILELCEKNNINTEDNAAFMYFVNQLDIRCRRLGLLDYYLSYNNNFYSSGLYLELFLDPNSEKVSRLLEKLENFVGLIVLEFHERLMIIFPKNESDKVLMDSLKELMSKEDFQYKMYNQIVDPKYQSRNIFYHKIINIEKD